MHSVNPHHVVQTYQKSPCFSVEYLHGGAVKNEVLVDRNDHHLSSSSLISYWF